MANPVVEQAVEAIEKEAFVEKIPDLQAHFNKLQTRLEKGGRKVQCAVQTNRGGLQRPSFWAGTRVQGGAPIQQFGADTSSVGSSTVPAWGRGTGSTWVSFAAAPYRLVNVCEISNLTMQATNGEERGLVKFPREEMDKSLLAFENGIEGLLNRDGSGTIDTVVSYSSGSGSGVQTSYVVVNNAASFVDQQVIQDLPAINGTSNGSLTITFVDPVANKLYFATALPGALTDGDILVVLGATGAAGSSIYGKDYWIQNGNVGTKAGVNIANYPGRFSSPTINFNNSGTITNSTAQRVESLRSRALGDEYDENQEAFWYTNPVQGVALSSNYYNPGITRLDEGGDRVPDTAKMYMQKTWGGREVVYSNTAEPSRMDLIVPSTFVFGELFPTRLHEWTPGNTLAAPPVNDGSGNTLYDSIMFAYERGFNLLCPENKANFFLQGLPIPSNS